MKKSYTRQSVTRRQQSSRPTTIKNLNKDCIGNILSFLNYGDWASTQLAAKIFRHEKHNIERSNGKKFYNVNYASCLPDIIYNVKGNILSFLGKPIDFSFKEVIKMIDRIFDRQVLVTNNGSICVSHIECTRAALGLPLTSLSIEVGKHDLALFIVSTLKLPIEWIWTNSSYGTDTPCTTIMLQGGIIFRIFLVYKDFFRTTFLSSDERVGFIFSSQDLKNVLRGTVDIQPPHMFDWELYRDMGMKFTNRVLFGRHPGVHCSPEVKGCEQILEPDKNVVLDFSEESSETRFHSSKFYDENNQLKTSWRLQLAIYKGLEVDLFNRLVYDREKQAVSGTLDGCGEVVEKVPDDYHGPTTFPRKCAKTYCQHHYWDKPYKGRIGFNIPIISGNDIITTKFHILVRYLARDFPREEMRLNKETSTTLFTSTLHKYKVCERCEQENVNNFLSEFPCEEGEEEWWMYHYRKFYSPAHGTSLAETLKAHQKPMKERGVVMKLRE